MLVILGLFLFILSGCQQTQPQEETKNTANKYSNGTFIGYSDATDNGYAWAKVTLEDDKLTEVSLMEITSKGNQKDYDTYEYEPSVKAQQKMPDRFVKANSADVETYSGATHSSEKYKQAVSRALKVAAGNQNGKYFNGIFQGNSVEGAQNGYAVALIELQNDDITSVELKEVTSGGEFRDYSQYDYEPAVKANSEMANRFVEHDSADVDSYSGATSSSEKYKEAVTNALLHASNSQDSEDDRNTDINNP